MAGSEISDEKIVLTTTFRRNGEPLSSPTWIVPLDGGRVGFWTSSRSGKVKRLRKNPALTMQPSNSRGKVQPGAHVVSGSAVLVSSGTDFDAVQSKVRAKYGAMVPISRFFNKVGHLKQGLFPYGDLVVVVTLDD
ncbi:MAG: putative F420-dependent enzyme [Frankiales bacterium]|nr:putative F420-dependent enzyme [Frankiales bacterium]